MAECGGHILTVILMPSGTCYASVPLQILPPVADAGGPDPPKGGKPPIGGKSGAVGAAPLVSSEPLIKRGALKLRLGIQATSGWRDWLRQGEKLMLRMRV